jgi:hypothetical protein
MLGDTSRFRDIPARGYCWSGPVPMGHWMGENATAHRLRRPVRASRPGGGLSVADLGDQRKEAQRKGWDVVDLPMQGLRPLDTVTSRARPRPRATTARDEEQCIERQP